jgi:hypothetical protein
LGGGLGCEPERLRHMLEIGWVGHAVSSKSPGAWSG